MSKKTRSPEKNVFDEAYARKIISIISLSALAGLCIWMILDPSGVEHSSVEKGSVYIMKEIWSLEAGIILLAITTPFLVLSIFKVVNMSKNAWYKENSGYFLFVNKERSSGNHSTYEGKDLMVFHPDSGNVYRLKNYQNSKMNKFYSALPVKNLSCDKSYWQADNNGFHLFHKGRRLENMTSKYDGDDLYVKAPDARKSFKLPNYRNRLDNVLREAESLN